jgi:branched-chain amino acid transport system permease protein
MLEQQIVNGVMVGSVYVLIAVSFTLAIGVLNFLNFSLPPIFMLCGMVAWSLSRIGLGWPLVIVAVFLTGAGMSLVIERFTYRWLRSTDHFTPLVSSMGFWILIENLVLIHWGSDTQVVASPFHDVSFRLFGLLFSALQLVGLAVAILLVAGLAMLIGSSNIGRGLRAVAENTDTAIMLGVDVDRVVPVVFVISGIFTALAALLFVFNYQQVRFDMGEGVALKGISAMVIGGMGSVWGAVVGGLLIGVVEVISIWRFGADFGKISIYGLLVTILIIRPTGLFGAAAIGQGRL